MKKKIERVKKWIADRREEYRMGVAWPQAFPEQTNLFKKPVGWDDEKDGVCLSLPLYRDTNKFISCWKIPVASRIALLFHGKIWLGVVGGGQPPVYLLAANTIFTKTNPNTKE